MYKKKELRTLEREPKTLDLCEQIKRVGLDPAMEREREREREREKVCACDLGLAPKKKKTIRA